MMKNLQHVFIPILCLIVTSVWSQTNLVQNGGYESGLDANWVLDAGGGSDVNYSLDNTSAIEGSNCLQAEVIALGSNSWSVQIKNAFGPVVEGSLYRATIWAKAATSGSTINYTIGKATAGYDEYATNYGLALTTEWTQYSLEFIAEVSTPDDITLALHITGTDTYWFDDFRVVEVVDEINSATIGATGNRVILEFNMNLMEPDENDQLPFFVYSAANEYTVSEITTHQESNKLNLYLADPVLQDEEITVEYIPGTLRTSAGIEIQPFTIEAVNNSQYTPPSAIAIAGSENRIVIYPMPATDRLTIESQAGIYDAIAIADLSGRILIQQQGIFSDQQHLNISNLTAGIYLVILKKSDEPVHVSQLIKN